MYFIVLWISYVFLCFSTFCFCYIFCKIYHRTFFKHNYAKMNWFQPMKVKIIISLWIRWENSIYSIGGGKFPVSHGIPQIPAGHIVSRGNTVHFWTFLWLPWDMVVSQVFTEIFRHGWLPQNCRDMMSPVGICGIPWDTGNFPTANTVHWLCTQNHVFEPFSVWRACIKGCAAS